jgi:hypothetical protein
MVFVGGIVVGDGMDQFADWHRSLNRVEEADELLVAVLLHAAADHAAIQHTAIHGFLSAASDPLLQRSDVNSLDGVALLT